MNKQDVVNELYNIAVCDVWKATEILKRWDIHIDPDLDFVKSECERRADVMMKEAVERTAAAWCLDQIERSEMQQRGPSKNEGAL